MPSPPAAVAFRLLSPSDELLGVANGSALENVTPDQLVDGTLAWVVAENSLYFLDKSSVLAVAPPTVIATARGAAVPGRWIQYAGGGGVGATGPTGAPGPAGATGATGPTGTAGANDPWDTLQWVNGGSAVASPNGSIGRPWLVINDAIAAVIDGGSVNIGAGTYAAATVANTRTINFYGAGGAQGGNGDNAHVAGFTIGIGAHVRLDSLTLDGGITCSNPGGTLYCSNVSFAGQTVTGSQWAMRFFCDGLETGNPGNVIAVSLFSLGVEFNGTIAVTTLCTLRAGVCSGALTCDLLAAEDQTFDANVTATTQASFVDCDFTDTITITSPLILMDAVSLSRAIAAGVTFSSPPVGIETTFVSVDTINGCVVAAPVEGPAITGNITIDPGDGNDFVIDPGWTGTITLGTGSNLYGREIITLKRLDASAHVVTVLNGGPGAGNVGPDAGVFPASIPLVCDFVKDVATGNWSLEATKRLP